MRVAALLLAAGRGERVGARRPKALLQLAGKALWVHAAEALARSSRVDWVLPVVPEEALGDFAPEAVSSEVRAKVLSPIAGGAERQDSMRAGLAALPRGVTLVAVHDAARPLLRSDDVDRVIAVAEETGAALLAVTATDTIKRAREGVVVETPSRAECFAAQTPQVFRLALLREAIEDAAADGYLGTDDAELVERLGHGVRVVEGQRSNMKITYPGDLEMAERLLGERGDSGAPRVRVGQGFDAHQLVAGRPLRLGGVEIPFERGLEGHSDGDVLLHAIASAYLGAAGAGDLGTHFPSSDATLHGVDSGDLLRRVVMDLEGAGFALVNLDATVIAQVPRLGPHRDAMEKRVAELLGAAPERVNVKVTSTDRLGAVGREEGIAAQAIVMLSGGA